MSALTDSSDLAARLRQVVGEQGVISLPDELVVYECDAFTLPRSRPLAVVFPKNTQEVVEVVNLLRDCGISIVPRGSGTGLTGGIVPVVPGVQVSTARMNSILEIDLRNRCALVEAGVTNWALSQAVAASPYHYAPDPSSQKASTIGGNVATNAGGLHTLKYGVTVNHILGIEMVLEDGSVQIFGGPEGGGHTVGPDLVGLICGTEGTLGIITKIWCRLTPRPVAFRTAVAMFNDPQSACRAVADIIAAGIVPAALEMMDGELLAIVEEVFKLGFPKTARSMLLMEVDGQEIGLDEDLARLESICRNSGATDFQGGSDPVRRAQLWSARKRAFGAIGRITPNYCTQDACVPRSKLPDVIAHIAQVASRYKLRITNVFHAGDGNLHPAILYDETEPDAVRRTLAAAGEILHYCVSIGGTVTGEHGVGIEKLGHLRDMFSPTDLQAMHTIRAAFVDQDRMNPFKTLPREGIDIDLMHPMRMVPQ